MSPASCEGGSSKGTVSGAGERIESLAALRGLQQYPWQWCTAGRRLRGASSGMFAAGEVLCRVVLHAVSVAPPCTSCHMCRLSPHTQRFAESLRPANTFKHVTRRPAPAKITQVNATLAQCSSTQGLIHQLGLHFAGRHCERISTRTPSRLDDTGAVTSSRSDPKSRRGGC